VNVNNLLHSFTFHIQSRHVKISKSWQGYKVGFLGGTCGYFQPQGATKFIYALYNKRQRNSNNVPTAVGFGRGKSF